MLFLGAGILYLGLVLTTYRLDGPRLRPRRRPHNLGRTALDLVVWLGVKVLASTVHAARAALDMLSDTSADVGEWYLRRQEHAAQALHKSRLR